MSNYDNITEGQSQTVVALFATRDDADQGMTALLNVGFPSEDVGVLEPDDLRRWKKPARRGVDWGIVGAILGALGGGLMGTLGVGFPDVAGMVVGGVTGTGLGAYVGVVVGGLFGSDPDRDLEPYFVQALRAGRSLVAADVSDAERAVRAAAVLLESRAQEVDNVQAGILRAKVHHPAVTGDREQSATEAA